VALALLGEIPQQLELGAGTTALLALLRAHIVRVDERPADEATLATRATTAAVTGLAWLAMVSLPYSEELEAQTEPSP
jgi:hypothetical protein